MKNDNKKPDAAILRQKAEEQLKKQQSKTSSLSSDNDLRKLLHELQVHQIELEMQNEELVVAKEKVEIANKKYTELYDFAPSGYLSLTKDGDISELNFAAAKLLGKERSRLIKSRFASFLSQNTRSVFTRFFDAIFTGKIKQSCEVSIATEGNQPIDVAIVGILSQNDEICQLTLVDITGQKQAENLLQQTQLNYETFFNTIDDFLFVLDNQGNIIHTNNTVIDHLGYTREELSGLSVLMVHPTERREEAARIVSEMLSGNTTFCSVPIVTKSGDQIPVETRVTSGIWDGKPVIFGVTKDISKVKLSEEKFSKVFYLNPSVCSLSDLDTGKYIEVNDQFYSLLGFKKEEVIGKSVTELGIFNEEVKKQILSKADSSGKVYNVAVDLKTKNGDIKQVQLSAENIYIQDKKYRFTVFHDITERKRAEEALLESRNKYHELFSLIRLMSDTMPDLVWAKDLENKYIFANKAMCSVLLQAKDTNEPIGKTDLFFAERERKLHPENSQWHTFGELCANTDVETLKQMKQMQFDEYGNVNGKFLYLDVHKAPLITKEGKLIGVVGSARDITERIQAEMQLKEAEAKYRILFETMPNGFYRSSKDGFFIDANPAFISMLGYSSLDELKSIYIPTDIYFHESQRDELASDNQDFEKKTEIYRLKRKDGQLIWIEDNARYIKDLEGNVLFHEGICRDITEQKQAEETLRKSEENFRLSFDNSPLGVRIIALGAGTIYANKAVLDIYGYDSIEELKKTPPKERYTPQSYAEFEIRKEKRKRGEFVPSEYEINIVRKTGEIRNIQVYRKEIIWDGTKQNQAIYNDITERKQAEEKLQQASEHWSKTFDAIQDGIAILDSEQNVVQQNEAFQKIVERISTNHCGKHCFHLIHGTECPIENCPFVRTKISRKRELMELVIDGLVFEVAVDPILNENQELVGAVLIMTNITKRKRAEEALVESKNKYHELFSLMRLMSDTMPDLMWAKDLENKYIFANKAMCSVLLQAKDTNEPIGKTDLFFAERERKLHPENSQWHTFGELCANTDVETLKQMKQMQFDEYGNVNGKFLYLDVHKAPLITKEGKLIGVVGSARDITERIQAEEALKENNYRLELAMKTANMAWWEMDITTGLVTFEKRKAEMLGYAPEKFKHYKDFMALVHPDDNKKAMDAMRKHLDGSLETYEVEYRILNNSGEYKWFYDIGAIVKRDSQGNPLNITGLVIDITERKKIEKGILKEIQIRTFVSNIHETFTKEKNKDKLLEKVCQSAVQYGDFRMAWIGVIDEESKKVNPYCFAGFEDGYFSKIKPISIEESLEEGRGPTGIAIRTGKLSFCNDIENDPRMVIWKDEALKRGYLSLISIPIKQFGKIVGTLSLYSSVFNYFNSTEIDILVEMVDNISFALEAIETEEKRIQAENQIRKLSTAVEQSPVSIILTDTNGIIEYANRTTYERTGYTIDELLGKNQRIFHSGETPKSEYDHLWDSITAGEAWHGTFHNKKKNGELYWESCTISPMRDIKGKIIQYLAIKEDITKQIENELEIRELNSTLETKIKKRTAELVTLNSTLLKEIDERRKSEQKFSSAFQSNAALMAISEFNSGKYIDVNESFIINSGFSKEEIIGKTSKELDVSFDESQREQIIESIKMDIPVRDIDVNFKTKNGGVLNLLLSAVSIFVDNKRCLLTVAVDITALRIAVEEARKARIEADRANRAKSEFLSRMSHELRTPMNSILGFAQLLQMEKLNERQASNIKFILSSGQLLLNLINDVLKISRIESGTTAVSIEPVKICTVVEEMLDTIHSLAVKSGIELKFTAPDDTALFLNADQQSIKQVLLNLLNNAIKYNKPNGSVVIKIKERPKNKDGKTYIRISIVDTGIGISEENQKKIFNPFERVGAEKTEIEGAGLGLTVVKELISAMNGTVGVESVPQKGSTFWIELPKAESRVNGFQNLVQIAEKNPVLQLQGTILYIEDNASNTELIEQILLTQRPGIRLINSKYGKEAVQLASESKPDLIFLDLNLPDIHGSEVLRLLLDNKETNEIPVVVVSADATQKQIQRLIALGAKDYQIKPIDILSFLKIIDTFIK